MLIDPPRDEPSPEFRKATLPAGVANRRTRRGIEGGRITVDRSAEISDPPTFHHAILTTTRGPIAACLTGELIIRWAARALLRYVSEPLRPTARSSSDRRPTQERGSS